MTTGHSTVTRVTVKAVTEPPLRAGSLGATPIPTLAPRRPLCRGGSVVLLLAAMGRQCQHVGPVRGRSDDQWPGGRPEPSGAATDRQPRTFDDRVDGHRRAPAPQPCRHRKGGQHRTGASGLGAWHGLFTHVRLQVTAYLRLVT